MTQRIITIGTRLLTERRRQRLSVADAALGLGRLAGLGVSAALMRAWEQGQVPSRRYLPAIALWTRRPVGEIERLRRQAVAGRQDTAATWAQRAQRARARIQQPARPAGGQP